MGNKLKQPAGGVHQKTPLVFQRKLAQIVKR
jgi:hypothetical protein